MSDQERMNESSRPLNPKSQRKRKNAKPALLLFGKDVSAEDIAAAINAESKRQLETGDRGRAYGADAQG